MAAVSNLFAMSHEIVIRANFSPQFSSPTANHLLDARTEGMFVPGRRLKKGMNNILNSHNKDDNRI